MLRDLFIFVLSFSIYKVRGKGNNVFFKILFCILCILGVLPTSLVLAEATREGQIPWRLVTDSCEPPYIYGPGSPTQVHCKRNKCSKLLIPSLQPLKLSCNYNIHTYIHTYACICCLAVFNCNMTERSSFLCWVLSAACM